MDFIFNTLLTLYRMSDTIGKEERQTLTKISSLLDKEVVVLELVSRARDWTPQLYDIDPAMADRNAKTCQNAIERIKALVASNWNTKPIEPALRNWREKAKSLRDGMLAHLLKEEFIRDTKIGETKEGLLLISGLVRDANLIFLGSSPVSRFEARLKEATTFWNLAEQGLVGTLPSLEHSL